MIRVYSGWPFLFGWGSSRIVYWIFSRGVVGVGVGNYVGKGVGNSVWGLVWDFVGSKVGGEIRNLDREAAGSKVIEFTGYLVEELVGYFEQYFHCPQV